MIEEIKARWDKDFNLMLGEGYIEVMGHAIKDIQTLLSRLSKIKEAMEGWKSEQLSDGATLVVISDILNPCKPDQKDIEWARKEGGKR